MRVEIVSVLIAHQRDRWLINRRLYSSPQLLDAVAVALEIVEEMMHHLMRPLGPNCHLVSANVAELLERRQELWNQSQTHYDTSVIGDVRQASLDELLANELFRVKTEQRAQRLLGLERQCLAETTLEEEKETLKSVAKQNHAGFFDMTHDFIILQEVPKKRVSRLADIWRSCTHR